MYMYMCINPRLLSLSQTLAGFSDVDNFCDVVDALEAQGIEKHMDVSIATLINNSCRPLINLHVRMHVYYYLSHMQYHQRKRSNHDLLREIQTYEVSYDISMCDS